jgi:GTP pyrophosphokinase
MNLRETFEDDYYLSNYIASEVHDGQKRKGTGDPYITHPISVSKIVKAYGGSEDQIHAAVLHDTIEDGDGAISWDEIAKLFNEHVADIVSELTNDNDKINNLKKKYSGDKNKAKEEYMNKHLLDLSDDALLIKLADNYANVCDRPAPAQAKRILNNVNLLKRNRELTDDMLDLYEAIIDRIESLNLE